MKVLNDKKKNKIKIYGFVALFSLKSFVNNFLMKFYLTNILPPETRFINVLAINTYFLLI